jgi:hypothetical protein
MGFQWRRKKARAGYRDPFYAPERDVAYIGPDVIRAAMHAMDDKWWEPWFRQYMRDQELTTDDIVSLEAPLKFAHMVNSVIQATDPAVAAKESGFDQMPAPMQMAFYSRIGQCFLATVWSGVKDVGSPEDEPPIAFSELLDDIEVAFYRLRGERWWFRFFRRLRDKIRGLFQRSRTRPSAEINSDTKPQQPDLPRPGQLD